jgi:hypothetical protein
VNALRRAAAALVVVAVPAAAVVLDRDDATGQDAPVPVTAAPEIPGGAPPEALGTTFVCPGGPVNADAALADLTIRLLDLDGAPSTVTLTALTADAAPVALPPVTLAAGVPTAVRVADTVTGPWVAVVVDVDGSGVVVEQSSTGFRGSSDLACTTERSDRWWFAEADTTRTEAASVVLVNPGATDASVDMDFSTAEGRRSITGVYVPAARAIEVPLQPGIDRKAAVSMSLTARQGTVVAARLQIADGEARPAGRTLSLAVAGLSEQWWFADIPVGNGAGSSIVVSNPTDLAATATIEVRPDDPVALAASGGEIPPIQLSIPPLSSWRENLTVDRVPAGTYSVSVLSETGVALAADRVVTFGEGSDRRGLVLTPGAPASAQSWASARAVDPAVPDTVSVSNPTATAVAVTIGVLLPGGDLLTLAEDLPLATGATTRLRVDLLPLAAGRPLVVRATGDVNAERSIARNDVLGSSITTMAPVA